MQFQFGSKPEHLKRAMLLVAMAVLSLAGLAGGFNPLFATGSAHRDITRRAILRKTAEVCRDIAASEGRDFSLTIDDSLTAHAVQRACSSSDSSLLSTVSFQTSIATVFFSNALVDQLFLLSQERHFDDESFEGGRDVITTGLSAVKASARKDNFVVGRLTLGRVCHTLQDFYSHSNWVELGEKSPFKSLIQFDQPLENLAGPDVETCRSCTGGDCSDNLLPDVLQRGLLTSGYFNLFSSTKPPGKCSHGGRADRTSGQDPVGGINKDDIGSSHGSLHAAAATLAVDATVELLEDIRTAVGDTKFLRLMGLSQSSALCFVIDTTGSMSDDIAEAKRISFSIIDRKRGTEEEPSSYILVPFNDPEFGPVITTTNADVFKNEINRLTASGGGDNPELSMSGLQLALTAAPPSSEIFVFTDAPAKDSALKSTVTALIESSKSVVTFLLTDVFASRRRRNVLGNSARSISQEGAQLYRDLARASGGQAIEVTKSDLSVATAIIEDTLASAVVTVFQVQQNPGAPGSFRFNVDGTVRNVTVYITGVPALTFNLISPTGESQNSSASSEPLASVTRAGNLRRLSLNTENQIGTWEIAVNSNSPYTVKVTGQSSLNIIFNLVEAFEGAHSGFTLKEGRPLSGSNISILVTVTGGDTVTVTDVSLFDSSRPTEVNGTLQVLGGSDFLVSFTDVPEGEFVLRLRGVDSSSPTSRSSPSVFQRQATTQLKTSSISVTAQVNNSNIEPGSTVSIPFTVTVATNGVVDESASGTFTVRANNDRSYTSSSPNTVAVAAGTGNGTVTLTVPASADTGTDVTLTIEAEDVANSDINYAVLRFSVVAKVTDRTRPVCQVVSLSESCPSPSSPLCSSSRWVFIANLTDGVDGSGLDSVSVRQGDGILNTSMEVGAGGENITVATYSASCCSQSVELAMVDRVGNVGTCTGQIRQAATTTSAAPNVTSTTAAVTDSALTNMTTPIAVITTSTGGSTLSMACALWFTVLLSFILQHMHQ